MGRRTIAIVVFVAAIITLAVVGIIYVLQPDGLVTEEVPDSTPIPGTEGEADVAPPSSVEEVSNLPPTNAVYVSLQTVPRGFQYPLTEAELEGLIFIDQRVDGSINSNVITDIEDILGMYARNAIFQGETLTKGALVDDPTLVGVEDYGPSSLIPSGSIAAAIPMDRLNSVAYALAEGDHIDIMITFFFYQIDEEFQTYLQNAGIFFLEETLDAAQTTGTEGTGEAAPATTQGVFIISPYGRFEELPTGDLAHIGPSEDQRPIPVSMILQNAKVIQVGAWTPPALAQVATPVPTPSEDGQPTPTPLAQVTPIPTQPDVLVVALSPQQQLMIKYAIESKADIDFALRGANDSQLYTVENIDLDFILQRFGIEVPPNFNYSVGNVLGEVSATPEVIQQEGTTTEGGG